MQEEVNQKTMALSIRTTKLTGKVLAAAFLKVVRAAKAHHQKALTPKGRQSVAKLMNHYGAKNSIAIYAVLIQSIAVDGDPMGAIWGCVGYTVLLCFTLFKTGSLSKSIFNAS